MSLKATIKDKFSPDRDKLSEGEIFICEYLNEKQIKFQTQVKIERLKYDSKAYRIADFYLPNYNIYIEYFGQWDKSEEANLRYRDKKKVYQSNNIPCVYLYPENLGIIEYVLNNRIRVELTKRGMHKQLFRHRFRRLIDDRGDLFFYLFISMLTLSIADYKTQPQSNAWFISFFSGIILFQLYRLFIGYIKYFYNDKRLPS